MFSFPGSFQSKSGRDRIFISYRRADSEGYAGRLEDTLKSYFGERRVFRDVGGIMPGENFQHKIAETIEGAVALIVLIGPNWLATNDDGVSRLQESGDYVAGEIKAALGKGRLVVPVLVQGARMPLAENLPEALRELTQRNAITINDESWAADVTRLARILSFDVSGSVAERKLVRLKYAAYSLLLIAMIFTLLQFSQAAFSTACSASAVHPDLYPVVPMSGSGMPATHGGLLFGLGSCEDVTLKAFTKGIAAVNPIAILIVSLLLAATTVWIDPARRKYIWATVVIGCLGTLLTFVFYIGTVDLQPVGARVGAFVASSSIITVMLVLMGLSGFRPNESVS